MDGYGWLWIDSYWSLWVTAGIVMNGYGWLWIAIDRL